MTVTIKGADELSKALRQLVDVSKFQKVVEDNTKELEKRMRDNANFKKGYETGETKASITSETRNGGMVGAVYPTTDHAAHLIHGTRHMEAQDFLRPALYKQRAIFLRNVREALKE